MMLPLTYIRLLIDVCVGLILVGTAASTANASVTVPLRSLCSGGVLVDYHKPLGEMPSVHHLVEAEPVWLSGQKLKLESSQPVLVGNSRVELWLRANRAPKGAASPVQVTVELLRVTRAGSPIERVDKERRFVKAPSGEVTQTHFEYEVPGRRAFYRLDVTLRGTGGKRVKFGEYFRVLKEHVNVRARAKPTVVGAGGRLRWVVEDRGTTGLLVPTEALLEQLVNGQWNPAGPPVQYVEAVFIPGGQSYGCPYTLPPTLEPGQYRLRLPAGSKDKKPVFFAPFTVT